MKIAVFHELPYGGARSAVNELSKGLSKFNTVDLYTTEKITQNEKQSYTHTIHFKFNPKKWNGNNWKTRLFKDSIELFNLYVLHKKIAQKIDAKEYDVLFINASKYIESPFLLRFSDTKKIFYCHDPHDRLIYDSLNLIPESLPFYKKYYERFIRKIRKLLDKKNFQSADIIIANSKYTQTKVKQTYGISSRISYLGVDTNVFYPEKVGKKFDILFIGSKQRLDGYDTLQEVSNLLPKDLKIKKLLIEDEWLDDPGQLRSLYNSAKIYLALAVREPFGLGPLEAMACGIPVIAVDEAGYRESVIDGKTGYLVKRNAIIIAKKINHLLKNDKLRESYSEASINLVKKNWTWDKSLETLYSIFDEAFKSSSSEFSKTKPNRGGLGAVAKSFEVSRKLLLHSFFSAITQERFFVIGVLIISLFMNLYQIYPHTLFIGDIGKDYLAARDMILTGKIPLVGITSSVVWLHQGPLSVYLIGLALWISGFNPYAPAVLYALLGVGATYMVYRLGKQMFRKEVGLLSALFFSTSPIVVVNARMPYHTSPIPLFASIFFLLLYSVLKGNRKILFWLFLSFGIVLQFELSNAVILIILGILFLIYRPSIKKKEILVSLLGLLLGILPFILYDLTHKFVYSIGFPLWIANRIRLFFASQQIKGSSPETSAISQIYQQGAGSIFPKSIIIVLIEIIGVCIALIKEIFPFRTDKKNIGLLLVVLWFIIPLIGYTIHRTPGVAYFPLLFPALSLLLANAVVFWQKRIKIIVTIFIVICMMNAIFLIQNDYFLFTTTKANTMPPERYAFGYSMQISQDAANAIIKNAKGRKMQIKRENQNFQTENFEYFILQKGGKIVSKSDLIYTFYINKDKIPNDENLILQNKYFYLTQYEK